MRLTDWRITSREMKAQMPEEEMLACESAFSNICAHSSLDLTENSTETIQDWAYFLSQPVKLLIGDTKPTCKCKEHASRFEEVVSSFAFPSTWSQQTQRAKDHEGQAEDGDGCSGDVVLWNEENKNLSLNPWRQKQPGISWRVAYRLLPHIPEF